MDVNNLQKILQRVGNIPKGDVRLLNNIIGNPNAAKHLWDVAHDIDVAPSTRRWVWTLLIMGTMKMDVPMGPGSLWPKMFQDYRLKQINAVAKILENRDCSYKVGLYQTPFDSTDYVRDLLTWRLHSDCSNLYREEERPDKLVTWKIHVIDQAIADFALWEANGGSSIFSVLQSSTEARLFQIVWALLTNERLPVTSRTFFADSLLRDVTTSLDADFSVTGGKQGIHESRHTGLIRFAHACIFEKENPDVARTAFYRWLIKTEQYAVLGHLCAAGNDTLELLAMRDPVTFRIGLEKILTQGFPTPFRDEEEYRPDNLLETFLIRMRAADMYLDSVSIQEEIDELLDKRIQKLAPVRAQIRESAITNNRSSVTRTQDEQISLISKSRLATR